MYETASTSGRTKQRSSELLRHWVPRGCALDASGHGSERAPRHRSAGAQVVCSIAAGGHAPGRKVRVCRIEAGRLGELGEAELGVADDVWSRVLRSRDDARSCRALRL